MTEPLNGLRFDIYERVHLPDDVAAIEELEEIELVPHMQAQTREDQVLLRGHLLLSGVYRPQDQESGGGSSQLEHWIPVEISLPQNRVQRVEDLAVEIDNFDVDLISTRSLNVTGVLALRGLQGDQQQSPVWRDDSFTVVHQAENETVGLAEPPVQEIDRADLRAEPESEPFPEPAWQQELPEETGAYGIQPEYRFPDDQGGLQVDKVSEPAFPDGYSAGLWQSENGWGDLSPRQTAAEPVDVPDAYTGGGYEAVPLIDAAPDDKLEMKVAVGSKSLEPPPRTPSGIGMLSQLGQRGDIREAELQAAKDARTEAVENETSQARTSSGDELEWTKLFLNKGEEAQPFRRVKMCIVQREETLESIAARYNVQPREIQARNRLSDPYLSEGQVLYIP